MKILKIQQPFLDLLLNGVITAIPTSMMTTRDIGRDVLLSTPHFEVDDKTKMLMMGPEKWRYFKENESDLTPVMYPSYTGVAIATVSRIVKRDPQHWNETWRAPRRRYVKYLSNIRLIKPIPFGGRRYPGNIYLQRWVYTCIKPTGQVIIPRNAPTPFGAEKKLVHTPLTFEKDRSERPVIGWEELSDLLKF